jgi:flagellar basal-body rod modification protein FlgD
MASAINPITSATTAGSTTGTTSSSSSSSLDDGVNEEMFLQLLVAQLKNQDPMNPTDSTQFVSQLAQFSELEQVIGIRSDIESQMSSNSTSSSTTSGTSSTSGSSQT